MNSLRENIYLFLLSRKAIKISEIERESGTPKGTLRHFMKGRRKISENDARYLVSTLSKYGFDSTKDYKI